MPFQQGKVSVHDVLKSEQPLLVSLGQNIVTLAYTKHKSTEQINI